jgi:choline/glycine/proline betaine transport protein
MDGWREDLRRVIEEEMKSPPEKSHASVEKARREITRFINRTALPALEALKDELEKYDRRAEIDRRDYQTSLTVYHGDREEFSYMIRGRAYHTMFFAFPEFGDPGKETKIGRAEVVLNTESDHGQSVSSVTREAIIRDFIKEYAKWLGRQPEQTSA